MSAALLNPNPEVVKALLAGGADVNARDKDGGTALMCAASSNPPNPKVVKALVAGGADIRAVDNNGHDARWYVRQNMERDKKKSMQILKEYISSGQ